MNWETHVEPEPKDGDVRIINRFFWFPEDILGTTYWMQNVTYFEKFQTGRCYGCYHGWLPCRHEEWHKKQMKPTPLKKLKPASKESK